MVARRILDAAGVTRLGRRIRSSVEEGVEFAELKGWIREEGGVLQSPGVSDVPVRDRSGTDTHTRDIENIPDGEIEEAVRRLLEGTYGAERENVIRQVSRLLGFSKMGSSIHDGIDSVVADMIDRGELTTDDDTLQLAATDADSDVKNGPPGLALRRRHRHHDSEVWDTWAGQAPEGIEHRMIQGLLSRRTWLT